MIGKNIMNNEHHENRALRSPLIFTVPAYPFVVPENVLNRVLSRYLARLTLFIIDLATSGAHDKTTGIIKRVIIDSALTRQGTQSAPPVPQRP